ncbi:hypothetical protein [Pseudomonas sp. 460]|uniref:hypothetical protein n=1 Tax=Pseudomonas sp. 460 TaxID=2485142 RepID=UPI0010494D10|nr:hypothetical protein [Pseudomonas sp. 460]TCV51432.1 hypothetical protein EDB99_10798 [Pseudomonas sp. 460]
MGIHEVTQKIIEAVTARHPSVTVALLKCPAFGNEDCAISFSGDGHGEAASEWVVGCGGKATIEVKRSWNPSTGDEYTYSVVSY